MRVATDQIRGAPDIAGTYRVQVTATDQNGATDSASFTWTVNTGPLTLSQPANQTGTVGTRASLTMRASGGTGPYTWSVTGLPPGLNINGNNVISGVPTAAGTYAVTVTVTDAVDATDSVSFSWYISPLQVLPVGPQQWEIGVPVNLQMQVVNGSPPYTWSVDRLPAGLSISATTGLISGTPVEPMFPQYIPSVTVSVKDSTGITASKTFQDQVNSAVQLYSIGSRNLVVGQTIQQQVKANYGWTPYTFTASNLPPGLSISTDGVISGTATTPGSYLVRVVVTDGVGGTGGASGTWTVNP
jgi:hypothetical protein